MSTWVDHAAPDREEERLAEVNGERQRFRESKNKSVYQALDPLAEHRERKAANKSAGQWFAEMRRAVDEGLSTNQ